MKSKDKHIDKFLHGPLPDPEIPVDDAWAGMIDMLGAAAGQGADGTKWPSEVWKSVAKLKGMFGVVSAVVATSAIAVIFILNTEPNNRPTVKQIITSKTTGPAPVKTDFGKPDVTTDTSHSNTTNTPSEVTSRKNRIRQIELPQQVATIPGALSLNRATGMRNLLRPVHATSV